MATSKDLNMGKQEEVGSGIMCKNKRIDTCYIVMYIVGVPISYIYESFFNKIRHLAYILLKLLIFLRGFLQ